MTAIIVDDEPRSHEALKSLLETHHPDISILASSFSVAEGYDQLLKYQPDIIFLDIELPDGLGFDLLRQLKEPEYPVIFITAHQQYAITAIEFGAFGYLMKPFQVDKLADAIEKVKRSIKDQTAKDQIELLLQTLTQEKEKKLPTRMSISTIEGIFFFEIKNIIYIKAEGNYSIFIIEGQKKKIISSTPFGYYTKKHFAPYREFQKTHRSYLVNLHHVVHFNRAESYLLMSNGDKVNVTRDNRGPFLDGMAGI